MIHDVERDVVILTEQFRIAAAEKGSGYLLELAAGSVEEGEERSVHAPRASRGNRLPRPQDARSRPSTLRPARLERVHLFYEGEARRSG
ncbi:MAG: hypothetical protein R3C52_08960 [Hyphomonadaceae bacterium]